MTHLLNFLKKHVYPSMTKVDVVLVGMVFIFAAMLLLLPVFVGW